MVERPIYPWDLVGSIYVLLGIDLNSQLPHPDGRSIAVSPLNTKEIPEKETGGILKEIMPDGVK